MPAGAGRGVASLGQVPLSAGEIELYSRQDEAARRRRRLLAVREQEKRLAQQVTARYRANLQALQSRKARETRRQLSAEQRKLLTELHRRYQSSLQSMGAAQRNARQKLLELLEQAQLEQAKWRYNEKVAGRQRTEQAQEVQQEEEAVRTAGRRQVEQNLRRLQELSGQQRVQASERARKEQELALQRAKKREEIERLRRMQSSEEVVVTKRPHEKDVQSYQFTRTHCVTPAPVALERPLVTVIRHNKKHPTAMRGEEEAKKYRDEMDRKRERDRLVVEEQVETAEERGKAALDDATSRQQGQQALEWLALVDKMERRQRGQNLGAGDEYPLDVVDADGRAEDPERMAERAFAQLLGLGEQDSVDLSAFSIETDEDANSADLAEAGQEQAGGDEVAKADDDYRVKVKAAKQPKLSDSFEYLGDRETIQSRPNATGEQRVKATHDGFEKHTEDGVEGGVEPDKWGKSKAKRGKDLPPESAETPLKSRRGDGKEQDFGSIVKIGRDRLTSGGKDVSSELKSGDYQQPDQLKHNGTSRGHEDQSTHEHTTSAARDNRRRLRHSYGIVDERPEGGTDSEEDNVHSDYRQSDGSIERLENRLQEVLDLRISKPHPDRSENAVERQRDSMSSASSRSENSEHILHLDESTASSSKRGGRSSPRQSLNDNDGAQNAGGAFLTSNENRLSPLSLSAGSSEHAVSVDHHSVYSVKERPDVGKFDYSQPDHIGDSPLSLRQSSVRSSTNGDNLNGGMTHDAPETNANVQGNSRIREDVNVTEATFAREADEANINLPGLSTAPSRARFHGSSGGHYEAEEITRLEGRVANYPGSVASQKQGNPMLRQEEPNQVSVPHTQDRYGERLSRSRFAEHDEYLTSRSRVASEHTNLRVQTGVPESRSSDMGSIDQNAQSSEASFAPSQKPLSHLGQQNDDRPLTQRFIHEHFTSFSSSEVISDNDEEEKKDDHSAELLHPSTGSSETHPSVNLNPYDRYRRQIDHQARRSSTSAASVEQYSLPPSDTHSSFDDSFDRLHPGYGEDSFVNELVPMFPKRTIPQPPRSLEDEGQALEQYDVQLVAPNMSRMLTTQRHSSLGRSRQYPVHQGHTRTPDLGYSRRDSGDQPTERRTSVFFGDQSSAGSSESEIDAKSADKFVGESPVQRRLNIRQAPNASTAIGKGMQTFTHRLSRDESVDSLADDSVDNYSEISESASGVSSLGFAVQLHLAAGITRRHGGDKAQREVSNRISTPRNIHAEGEALSEVEHDSASERSYASDSSMSMDAHFNYLANMTSAVGKSLPLHLRLPAMIYGKKDMNKPPAPMARSSSSPSSVDSVDNKDPSEALEEISPSEQKSFSQSSVSESLEEQYVSPRRSVQAQQRQNEQRVRESDSKQRSPVGGEKTSSDADSNTSEDDIDAERSKRLAFDSIKEKVALLPPPPLGSLDMSQPPSPLQNFDRSLVDSQSSSSPQSRQSDSTEKDQTHRRHERRLYEAEEERKLGDSSSGSGAFSPSDASSSSSFASSQRQSPRKAERMVIPKKEAKDDDNGRNAGEEGISLAEAFQRRHPRFRDRIESHRDKLRRQREKQQKQQQQQQRQQEEAEQKVSNTTRGGIIAQSPRGRSAASSPAPLPPAKHNLLDRLAKGSRAKISSREMKERSRRLYHQLPEVVERKRQEEMVRRRRQRLDELREQEKQRRLQQKQRRQQQLQQQYR